MEWTTDLVLQKIERRLEQAKMFQKLESDIGGREFERSLAAIMDGELYGKKRLMAAAHFFQFLGVDRRGHADITGPKPVSVNTAQALKSGRRHHSRNMPFGYHQAPFFSAHKTLYS